MAPVDQVIAQIDQRMGELRDHIDVRCDTLEDRVQAVDEKASKTNGHVFNHHEAIARMGPQLEEIRREIKALKDAALHDPTEAGENRVLRVWMLGAAAALIIGTIAVLGFFGLLRKPAEPVTITPPAAVIR